MPQDRRSKRKAPSVGATADRQALASLLAAEPSAQWGVTATVPGFAWQAWSKNRMWVTHRGGGKHLAPEAKQARGWLHTALTREIHAQGIRPAHNRYWVGITVYPPDLRGDPTNVVDLVVDAVKTAVGVDDHWAALHGLDWDIDKQRPRIVVSISQTDCWHASVCSACGMVLPLDRFGRRASAKLGVASRCKDCSRQRNA